MIADFFLFYFFVAGTECASDWSSPGRWLENTWQYNEVTLIVFLFLPFPLIRKAEKEFLFFLHVWKSPSNVNHSYWFMSSWFSVAYKRQVQAKVFVEPKKTLKLISALYNFIVLDKELKKVVLGTMIYFWKLVVTSGLCRRHM